MGRRQPEEVRQAAGSREPIDRANPASNRQPHVRVHAHGRAQQFRVLVGVEAILDPLCQLLDLTLPYFPLLEQMIYFQRNFTLDEIIKGIERVELKDIRRVGEEREVR